uniref:Uncharacterized protein n=1 Tax=Rhizophora mucronata TaxID=61149 RepID=A0A2P2PGL2_RHIMU
MHKRKRWAVLRSLVTPSIDDNLKFKSYWNGAYPINLINLATQA